MIFYDSVTGQLYRSYFTGIENQYSYKQTASMNISGKGKFGDTLSAPAIYLTASTGHRFIDIYGNDGTSIIAQIRGAGGFPGNSSGGQYGQIGVVNRANTNHMVTMLGINGTLICQSFRVSNLNDANQFTEITFPYNSGGVFPSYALKFPKGNGTLVRTVNGIEGDSTGNIDLSFATGSIWINGNGAPTDGVGFNGNYYFDSVSKAAYFRRNGSWGFQGYWLQALPTTPNLQQVLNAGNTATQGATFGNTVVAPSYNLTSGSTNISLRPQTDAGSMIAYFPMRAEDQSVVYEQDMIDSLDNRAARISKTTTATTSLSTLATINCSTANTVYTIQFTATGINSAGDVGSFKMYSVVKNIGGTLTVVEQLGEQTVADPGFTSGGFSLGVSVSGTNAFIKTEPGTALQTAWTVKYDVVKATLP
ncbi:MAG: hypothetical protein EOP49_05055 [Sphingobacteriales bacterium]|nr:MAG: hypothetical protein EOP49_05055 [Sphingobacteriales bacterium]